MLGVCVVCECVVCVLGVCVVCVLCVCVVCVCVVCVCVCVEAQWSDGLVAWVCNRKIPSSSPGQEKKKSRLRGVLRQGTLLPLSQSTQL